MLRSSFSAPAQRADLESSTNWDGSSRKGEDVDVEARYFTFCLLAWVGLRLGEIDLYPALLKEGAALITPSDAILFRAVRCAV